MVLLSGCSLLILCGSVQCRTICLAGSVLMLRPLTNASWVQFLVCACEDGIWSPGQSGVFSLGTLDSLHSQTTKTPQTAQLGKIFGKLLIIQRL